MSCAIKTIHLLKNNRQKKLDSSICKNSDCLIKKMHNCSVDRDGKAFINVMVSELIKLITGTYYSFSSRRK